MGQQGEDGGGAEVRGLTVTRQRVVQPPDAAETVAELVRVAFGLVAVGLGVALRTLEPAPGPTRTVRGSQLPVTELSDVVVGTAWGAARATGRLATAGGRVAAVDCAWSPSASRSAVGGPTMTFVGDSGSVEFTASPMLLGGFDAATGTERWEPGGDDPTAVMLGEFVSAVGGGPPTGPDGAAGVRTMRIVQAAHESVRTGQPVDVAVSPAGRRA